MSTFSANGQHERLVPRRVHVQGMATVALGVLCGVAGFVWIVLWGVPAQTALSVETAFGPPSTLARGARGADTLGARESLVLRSDNRGQVLFGRYCDSCHPGGTEGVGASLRSSQFKRTNATPEKIIAAVRKGGFEMPAFSSTFLSDADLADIAAYVVALPEAK